MSSGLLSFTPPPPRFSFTFTPPPPPNGGSFPITVFILVGLGILIFKIWVAIWCYRAARDRNILQIQVGMQDLLPDPYTVDATVNRFLQDMAKEKPLRYTSQQLSYYTRNYIHKLGSGGFGVVYRGLLPEGVPIAVKVLNSYKTVTKQLEEQFMAEVNSIGRTYHVNLVKLYGYCFDSSVKALVYEFMSNGSLDSLLFGSGEIQPALEWAKRHSIAVGIAKGIAYLHEECEQKIIHHDIKPGNVLLDSTMKPKVADFGLARLTNKDSTHVIMSGFKGTPGYAAPEVWTAYVTYKCDVYSFGMMLFEIVGKRRNHVRELSGTSKEWLPRWTYATIKDGDMSELLGEFGVAEEQQLAENTLKVALWCVQYSPMARPDMSVVVKMLEGGMEVPPPPNPFAHMEQTYEFDVNTSSMGSSCGYNNENDKYATYPIIHERRIDVVFKSR